MLIKKFIPFAVLFFFMLIPIKAETPICDNLSGDKKKLAHEIINSQYMYECCDNTIAECLKEKSPCPLATRLANNICRKVEDNQKKEKIIRDLSRRARSMMAIKKKASIDINNSALAGKINAPVELVVYACARCPYCSKIIPRLYKEINSGSLKGKVKLYFKVFPIRNHKFSKESGLAFIAAQSSGKFWPYILHVYKHFSSFSPDKSSDWAKNVGINKKKFNTLISASQTRNILIEGKKEGLINKVNETPAFFINGRRYLGALSPEEMIDVLEEEFDRYK